LATAGSVYGERSLHSVARLQLRAGRECVRHVFAEQRRHSAEGSFPKLALDRFECGVGVIKQATARPEQFSRPLRLRLGDRRGSQTGPWKELAAHLVHAGERCENGDLLVTLVIPTIADIEQVSADAFAVGACVNDRPAATEPGCLHRESGALVLIGTEISGETCGDAFNPRRRACGKRSSDSQKAPGSSVRWDRTRT
jgi:hypothetical protein